MDFIRTTHSKVESIFGIYKDSIFPARSLLTEREEIFFNGLCSLLKNEDYIVCPKVRVGDIILVKNNHWYKNILFSGRPWFVSGKIDRSHVDFVLIGKSRSIIKFAIELDDSSHHSSLARYHDQIKNEAFQLAGIPLKRFNSPYLSLSLLKEKGIL